MGFLRKAVTLVAAGIAANMVLKARRDGMASRASAGSGSDGPAGVLLGGSDLSGRSGMDSSGMGSTVGSGVSSVSGVVGGSGSSGGSRLGADSPIDAERLQRQGMDSSAAGGDSDNPFGSNSQEGSTSRTPGLSDFTRGA